MPPLLFMLGFLAVATSTSAQSPREQLQQMVEQLQKAPADNALRERLIKLAATMEPLPAVPDAAVAFEGRARFAFESAKSEADFLVAAGEYEKAVAAAPWVPGYYSDLCTIYQKAGKFVEAKRHCGFYLVGLTDPAQTTDVKRRIAGLEFGIEKANSPGARAEALVTLLRKTYSGRVSSHMLCGIKLNAYWTCTDDEARKSNWVQASAIDSFPKVLSSPVEFKVVGADGDTVQFTAGSRGQGCGKPNGADPNLVVWAYCSVQGALSVKFTSTSAGKPMIEILDSCHDPNHTCRRQQLVFD